MSTLQRRSPKISETHTRNDIRQAIDTLEDMPRIPEGTPASSSADGFHGQIKQDENYLYVYFDGAGWARIARNW